MQPDMAWFLWFTGNYFSHNYNLIFGAFLY